MFKIKKSESGLGLTPIKSMRECNEAKLHKINAMKQYYGLSQLMLLNIEKVKVVWGLHN